MSRSSQTQHPLCTLLFLPTHAIPVTFHASISLIICLPLFRLCATPSPIGFLPVFSSRRHLRNIFSTPFFVQPANEIEFMTLFSSLVDNIYRRLLDVERDSRYHSEITEPLRFLSCHSRENKNKGEREGNFNRSSATLQGW